MKVIGKVEVELSADEQRKIALDYIYKQFNWKPDYFIEGGTVYTVSTYHTSHSWDETVKVREATATDYAIANVIGTLLEYATR